MSQKYEDPPEVFRGHLDECLRHLASVLNAKYPKGSKGVAKAKRPLADFCGVGDQTVNRWLNAEVPVGLPIIKLVCYLQLFGYKILEYTRIKPARRRFAELVAFGLLTPEDAAALIGYSTASQLFSVLKGSEGASDIKDRAMWDAWMQRRAELDQRKIAARENYRLDIPLKSLVNGEALCAATVSGMECLSALFDGGAAEKVVERVDQVERKRIAGLAQVLSQRLATLATDLAASEEERGEQDERAG
jgi:hypothetical protein